jgi:dephospho-CoA kinase
LSRPVRVALTGGIAAGKSEALAAFARHGAAVASSDELVHRLYAEDEEVRAAIRGRFGADAVDDRGRIAAVVFDDPAELEWLESLLHPRVRLATQVWLDEQTAAVAVVEIPLLYETGGESRFDKVVAITAPRDVREQRRPGFAARQARLIPDEEKLRCADFAFVNDGSLEALDDFVAGVMKELTSS